MNKKWCIKYSERKFLRWKTHFMEFDAPRVDSAINKFHFFKPKCVIEEIYVEYRRR